MKRRTQVTLIGAMLASAAIIASVDIAAARGAGGPGGFMAIDFATLDTDGSGTLTLEELQAQGQAKFAQADSNANGSLDKAELIEMLSVSIAERKAAAEAAGRQMRGGEGPDAARIAWMADGILMKKDENGDGLLSMAEMQPAGDRLEHLINRMDTDDDNVVSEAEFDAAKEHRGRGKDQQGSRP